MQTFFPMGPQPTLKGMNWSCVLFSFLFLFAGVLYVGGQNGVYVPPIALLMKEESVEEIETRGAQLKKP